MTHASSTYLIVGASSGIGRSLALALARERKSVALVGRSEERLARVAREVEMFGGEPLVLLSDVRDPISIQAALAQIVLRGQRIETAIFVIRRGAGNGCRGIHGGHLTNDAGHQCGGRRQLAGSAPAAAPRPAGRRDGRRRVQSVGGPGLSRCECKLFGQQSRRLTALRRPPPPRGQRREFGWWTIAPGFRADAHDEKRSPGSRFSWPPRMPPVLSWTACEAATLSCASHALPL